MDEKEIWLSDEDEGDFDEDDEETSDPTFFSLGLTYQGQEGGEIMHLVFDGSR